MGFFFEIHPDKKKKITYITCASICFPPGSFNMVTGIITSFYLLQKPSTCPYESLLMEEDRKYRYRIWSVTIKKRKKWKISRSVHKVYGIQYVILCICLEGEYNFIQFSRVSEEMDPSIRTQQSSEIYRNSNRYEFHIIWTLFFPPTHGIYQSSIL